MLKCHLKLILSTMIKEIKAILNLDPILTMSRSKDKLKVLSAILHKIETKSII